MIPRELASIATYPTHRTAQALEDPETREYLAACFTRYFRGDFGDISEEDTAANNSALADECGRVIAKYPAAAKLESDIYIISDFEAGKLQDIEQSQTVVLYSFEY